MTNKLINKALVNEWKSECLAPGNVPPIQFFQGK